MWIKSILSEDLVFVQQEGVSKKRVLDKVAEAFAQKFADIDAATLFKHLISRERLGSTGIGAGVAIPHCRFHTDGRTFCTCITLSEPIDFDAIDQQPVDVVFAMVVPEDSEKAHLERLAALAEALQNKDYVARVRAAKTREELFQAAIAE